jgi:hypothetical protein
VSISPAEGRAPCVTPGMQWSVRAILALSAASAAGCAGGPAIEPTTAALQREMAGAAMETAGEPGPQDRAFGEALVVYANAIDRLHAGEGAGIDAPIRAAVEELANAIERMPAASVEPALRRAARAMRDSREGLEGAEHPRAAIEGTQRSLILAATALLRLAEAGYREYPDILAAARAFAGAAGGIDPRRAPPDWPGVIDALVHAERLLAGMYAINVAPARGPIAPP